MKCKECTILLNSAPHCSYHILTGHKWRLKINKAILQTDGANCLCHVRRQQQFALTSSDGSSNGQRCDEKSTGVEKSLRSALIAAMQSRKHQERPRCYGTFPWHALVLPLSDGWWLCVFSITRRSEANGKGNNFDLMTINSKVQQHIARQRQRWRCCCRWCWWPLALASGRTNV